MTQPAKPQLQSARAPGCVSSPWPRWRGHLWAGSPYLFIVALYAVCILLVNPRGEFPLNDDWSYSRSAFRLGTENRLMVDEFSAPNLVGQALYGGLLIRLFGKSFLILRLSTLVLSCGLACLLWRLFKESGADSSLAWIAVLSWIFNPIQFCLSFTYMTEIPFLFLSAVALLAYARYLATQKIRPLLLCGAALGYAFSIRQTAVLFMAAIALCLLAEKRSRGLRQKASRLAAWAASASIFITGYFFWAHVHLGSTPAAHRKFELLRHLTAEQIQGNLLGLFFYLSFFLLPLLAYLVPALKTGVARSGRKVGIAILAAWILFSVSGMWWFHARYSGGPYLPARAFHDQMPFLLNVLFDTGLGPLTLDPTYYGPPPTPVHPVMWLGATLLVVAGTVVLGLLVTLGCVHFRMLGNQHERRQLALLGLASLAAVVLFEVIFSHVQEGGLFDRHILTAALPTFLLVCIFTCSGGGAGAKEKEPGAQSLAQAAPAGRPAFTTLAVLMLAILAYFCVTATHDYLAWNRLRWGLGNELLAQRVDPLAISGGFEFNGWNNYDTFRARGNIGKIYYWWYDRLDYLITMEPQEQFRVVKKMEYFSWLNRRNLPVYLLKRNDE